MSEKGKGSSRLISLEVSEETLRKDLENFRQKALDLGASMAKIISAAWVEIDERLRLKCSIPLCPYYDKCLFCPPHTPSPETMRKALSRSDPNTGNRSRMIIEANWGLGESVVGGEAMPDVYILDKESLEIVDRKLGTKSKCVVFREKGVASVQMHPAKLRC
ncbi:MAG: DUF2284 domain-containing protein [Desulfobacteraceae bacterium]|nr:DUF2284 domain-containing protein [Desulfobacteraceae bacterium]